MSDAVEIFLQDSVTRLSEDAYVERLLDVFAASPLSYWSHLADERTQWQADDATRDDFPTYLQRKYL